MISLRFATTGVGGCQMKRSMIACGLLALALCVSCRDQGERGPAVTSKPAETALTVPEKPLKPVKKGPSRDIQGFRTGMGMQEVKQLLAKKGIREYETGFSDLFVYSPAFGAEIMLRFTCGANQYILSNVELSTNFSASEADRAIAAYWDKLVAKYGPPARSDAGPASMNLCWGQCDEPGNWKLEAKTSDLKNGNLQFVATLSDDALVSACSELRRSKIDRWLNRWIADVQRFSPGMDFPSAAAVYRKRYQERLLANEERDEDAAEYPVTSFVVKDHEYFSGLDYEALMFEGEGPGAVTLKFTGDQAGNGDRLNKRLYYAYFSTTRFGNTHLYSDMQQKLDRFIKTFGDPLETTKQDDRIIARWVQGAQERLVTIEDSGRISLEQTDLGLKEAYREAAIRRLTELNSKKFDQPLF